MIGLPVCACDKGDGWMTCPRHAPDTPNCLRCHEPAHPNQPCADLAKRCAHGCSFRFGVCEKCGLPPRHKSVPSDEQPSFLQPGLQDRAGKWKHKARVADRCYRHARNAATKWRTRHDAADARARIAEAVAQRRLELIMEAHAALCVTVPDECPSPGDVCWEHCYSGTVRDKMLAEMRPDLTAEQRESLKSAAQYQPPHTPPEMEQTNGA